jgi:hypothetical protein
MRFLLGIAVALVIAGPAFGYDIDAFSKKSRKATLDEMTPWSDRSENASNKFYSEQYSFNVDPAGRADFWIQLVITNMGVANGRAALQVHLQPQGQKKIKTTQLFDKGAWSHRSEGGKVHFDLGKSRFSGGEEGWEGHFETDEFDVDWKVTNLAPPWRPGGGAVTYGGNAKAYYDVTVLVPRGTLELTATLKKTGEEVKIEGPAYADRSVSNVSPNLMAKKWVKIRRIGSHETVVLSCLQTPEQYESKWVGWFLVADKRGVQATGSNPKLTFADVTKDSKSGYDVPASVLLTEASGLENFQGAIKGLKLRKVTDSLAKLSALEKAVVSKLVKPFTFTYKAAFEFRYDRGGKTRTHKGKAAYHFEQITP